MSATRSIAEAEVYFDMLLDRLDRDWHNPDSAVHRFDDAEREWALNQSIRACFVEQFGRSDGESRYRQHMAAAERGRMQ